MPPRVSILIPAFDAAPWIEATLASAVGQTHSSIEIVVVNDGSRDDTLTRARAFADRHPGTIRVVTQNNAGAAAARNHAFRLSSGEFIQYLDADDLISPRKIELQLALLQARPAGSLATCRWGRFETDPAAARFVDDAVFHDFAPLDWLILHAAGLRMMHPAAWLVPRTVAERAGPWDESLSLNDDGEYFARVVLASTGLAFTADTAATSYYRSGVGGSLSGRQSPRALASLHRTGELLHAHLLAAEDSPRIRQALADHWQHLCYELYPGSPALSNNAANRSRALGGSSVQPPLGDRQRQVARFLGWRAARRLSRFLR